MKLFSMIKGLVFRPVILIRRVRGRWIEIGMVENLRPGDGSRLCLEVSSSLTDCGQIELHKAEATLAPRKFAYVPHDGSRSIKWEGVVGSRRRFYTSRASEDRVLFTIWDVKEIA